MKENKTNDSRRRTGYNSPSVRVIDVRMKTAILGISDPSYTEFGDGGNN